MSLDPMFLLAVLVVAFIAGFGWSAGCWLWGRVVSPRPAQPVR